MSVLLLRRIVRLAHPKTALVGLSTGETMEFPGSKLRISRLWGNLQVLDMTFAGKRGKQLNKFVLIWPDNTDSDIVTGLLEPILTASNYGEALREAKDLVGNISGAKWPSMQNPNEWGSDNYPLLTLEETTENAFKYSPLGQKITLKTSLFTLESTPRDFTMSNIPKGQADRYTAWPRTPTHAANIFKWLQQPGNLASLQNLTFSQVVSKIKDETGKYVDWH